MEKVSIQEYSCTKCNQNDGKCNQHQSASEYMNSRQKQFDRLQNDYYWMQKVVKDNQYSYINQVMIRRIIEEFSSQIDKANLSDSIEYDRLTDNHNRDQETKMAMKKTDGGYRFELTIRQPEDIDRLKQIVKDCQLD